MKVTNLLVRSLLLIALLLDFDCQINRGLETFLKRSTERGKISFMSFSTLFCNNSLIIVLF